MYLKDTFYVWFRWSDQVHGLVVNLVVFVLWLDSMIESVFSNLRDSVTPWLYKIQHAITGIIPQKGFS